MKIQDFKIGLIDLDKMSLKNKLIIFDCDGVLVDSELIVCSLRVEQLRSLGINISLEDFMARAIGGTPEHNMMALQKDFGLKEIPADYQSSHRERVKNKFLTDLKPIEGIHDVISTVPNRCIASNGNLEKINFSLNCTGLSKYFTPSQIFSSQMVSKPKPSPELFLHTCEAMGFSNKDTLVIEDSPSGILAAKEGGINVVALVAASHFQIKGQLEKIKAIPDLKVFYTASDLKTFLHNS